MDMLLQPKLIREIDEKADKGAATPAEAKTI